jgi:hypothetical protein
MDSEQNANPDFLASIIQVKYSTKFSKSDLMQKLSKGERITFVGNQAMEFMIGGGAHTELTTELGIQENRDNFMKGVIQFTRKGLNITGDYHDFFERMGVGASESVDLWDKIESKIFMAVG